MSSVGVAVCRSEVVRVWEGYVEIKGESWCR